MTSTDSPALNLIAGLLVGAAVVAGPYQAIDGALYITATMTGLRQGELVALRWRDVDWLAARVRVRQNYVLGEFATCSASSARRSRGARRAAC